MPASGADLSGLPRDRLARHISQITVRAPAYPIRYGRGQPGPGVHDLHAGGGQHHLIPAASTVSTGTSLP